MFWEVPLIAPDGQVWVKLGLCTSSCCPNAVIREKNFLIPTKRVQVTVGAAGTHVPGTAGC